MEYNKIEDTSLIIYKKNLCNYFELVSEIIQLEKLWSKDKSLEIEKKKSFIRGILRHSIESFNLTQKLKAFVKTNLNYSNDLNWITLPYPMIHLSNDLVEAQGGFHYDYENKEKKNFLTLWTQLTDYKYPSLSLVNDNKLIKLFPKIFIKLRLLNLFSKKITTSKDRIYSWNSLEIHKGNLNSSFQKSCAIQIKTSEEIYEFEQVQNLNIENTLGSTFHTYKKNELKDLFNEYSQNIDQVISTKPNEDVFYFVSKLLQNSNKNMGLSFAYSVLSQRIFSANQFFEIKNPSKKIQMLDIISILTGSSNLISFKRLENIMNNDIDEIFQKLKLIDKFQCMPYDTYQLNKMLGVKNYNQYKEYNF